MTLRQRIARLLAPWVVRTLGPDPIHRELTRQRHPDPTTLVLDRITRTAELRLVRAVVEGEPRVAVRLDRFPIAAQGAFHRHTLDLVPRILEAVADELDTAWERHRRDELDKRARAFRRQLGMD